MPFRHRLAAPLLALATFALFAAAGRVAAADDATYIMHPNTMPADAKRLTIGLVAGSTEAGRNRGYSSRREEPKSPTPALLALVSGTDFPHQFDLGEAPDGAALHVLVRAADDLGFVSENNRDAWEIALIRAPKEGEPEVLNRGLCDSGHPLNVTFAFPTPPLGSNGLREAKSQLNFSINGTSNGTPQPSWGITSATQLTGELLLPSALLKFSTDLEAGTVPSHENQYSLSIDPLEPGLPTRTERSKLFEYLKVGSAQIAVEKIANDFSEVTFVVLQGDLDELSRDQVALGSQLPEFAQVDLLARRVVTRRELCAEADLALVLIFGDPKSNNSNPGYVTPQQGRELSIPDTALLRTLEAGLEKGPAVAFVVRAVPTALLYEQYLEREPEYRLLADWSDPTAVTFSPSTRNQPYYGGYMAPAVSPSLSGLLNLPDLQNAVVVANPSGKVLYVGMVDKDKPLANVLMEANAALQKAAAGE